MVCSGGSEELFCVRVNRTGVCVGFMLAGVTQGHVLWGLCMAGRDHRALGEAMRHRKYTCAGDRDRQGGVPSAWKRASSAWMRRGSWPEEPS